MPLIAYEEKKISLARLALIEHANDIIAEYEADGYQLTLRQLYYQFVSRALIDNNQRSYSRLGDIISDARMNGLIDWDSITDRLRGLRSVNTWGKPEEIVEAVARQFKLDLWVGQRYRPEVWVEKDALAEVIRRASFALRVPIMVCRGYMSQSAMFTSGHYRLRELVREGVTPVVIHLGDHDPSGIDMTRDIEDRLATFAAGPVKVERIALNMAQVEEYGPPPNPAKVTDSRAEGYIEKYGGESWELDALEPKMLHSLIQTTIKKYRDLARFEEEKRKEDRHKEALAAIADNYEDVAGYLKRRRQFDEEE